MQSYFSNDPLRFLGARYARSLPGRAEIRFEPFGESFQISSLAPAWCGSSRPCGFERIHPSGAITPSRFPSSLWRGSGQAVLNSRNSFSASAQTVGVCSNPFPKRARSFWSLSHLTRAITLATCLCGFDPVPPMSHITRWWSIVSSAPLFTLTSRTTLIAHWHQN